MKRPLLLLAFILIILIAISTAAVSIVLSPAFIKGFDLSKDTTANIGTSLSGITTPFFSAISSILIFYALIKQIESSDHQRRKANADMIFLLLNQLDLELENFSYQGRPESTELPQVYSGYYALLTFFRSLKLDSRLKAENFVKSIYARKLLLLINSFNLIETRLERKDLDKDDKDILYYKLYNFYNVKLSNSLNFLIEENDLDENNSIKELSLIVQFYNKCNKMTEKHSGMQ